MQQAAWGKQAVARISVLTQNHSGLVHVERKITNIRIASHHHRDFLKNRRKKKKLSQYTLGNSMLVCWPTLFIWLWWHNRTRLYVIIEVTRSFWIKVPCQRRQVRRLFTYICQQYEHSEIQILNVFLLWRYTLAFSWVVFCHIFSVLHWF